MKWSDSADTGKSAETFQGFPDVVMAADIKPLYLFSGPGKKYPIGQGGADFPIRPVHQFQSQTGRRGFSAFQTFGQGEDSLFDFDFSLVRQMFKEAEEYWFRIKQHYRPARRCRKLLAELKTGPFARRIPASNFRSFLEGLADFVAGRREALSRSTAYSSNDSNTMGLWICGKA